MATARSTLLFSICIIFPIAHALPTPDAGASHLIARKIRHGGHRPGSVTGEIVGLTIAGVVLLALAIYLLYLLIKSTKAKRARREAEAEGQEKDLETDSQVQSREVDSPQGVTEMSGGDESSGRNGVAAEDVKSQGRWA